MVQATARVLAMIAIVIPMAGLLYMLFRMARKIVSTVWQGTAGKPLRRMLVGVIGAAAVAGIAYAWFPHDGNYRPIEASERGTLSDIMYALRHRDHGRLPQRSEATQPVAASKPLSVGQRGVMSALWDTRTPPPTVNSPQLAVILDSPAAGIGGGQRRRIHRCVADVAECVADDPSRTKGWVFPFDKPIAPTPGDGNNQAMAINTTDNTVVYDAAFALVWATDAEDAMNINEAHAYASCNNCAAVAVAYQVVFVVDKDDTNDNVAVPQNLAGALNYDCVNCITYALARQLFVTLDEDLSPTAKEELDALWSEIAAYGEQIADRRDVDVNLIDERLEDYTHKIMLIVETDQPGTFSPDLFPSLTQTTAPPTTAASTTAAPPPSATSPPPTTAAPESTATEAAAPTATATEEPSLDRNGDEEPAATTDPTTQAPATDSTTVNDSHHMSGDTSGGTTAGGTTSDGSTSGGTENSDTSP